MAGWALRCTIWKTGVALGCRGGGRSNSSRWWWQMQRDYGFCTEPSCKGPLMLQRDHGFLMKRGHVSWSYGDDYEDEDEDEPERPEDKDFYYLSSVSEPARYRLHKEEILPAGFHSNSKEEARCVGSSHGWLAFLNTNNNSLSIVNNFLPASTVLPSSISLPPIPRGSDVKKLILSADPYDYFLNHQPDQERSHTVSLPSNYEDILRNCMAVAIIGPYCDLTFCQLGDTEWTLLKGSRKKYYGEIMYSVRDQCLYATGGHSLFGEHAHHDQDYSIEAWDLLSHEKQEIQLSLPEREFSESQFDRHTFYPDGYYDGRPVFEKRYLVEFAGDVFLVMRIIGDFEVSIAYGESLIPEPPPDGEEWTYETEQLNVYKLKRDHDEKCRLELVKDYVPASFFVGLNHSFGTVACGYMQKDCVYYTDDFFDRMNKLSFNGGHDSGALRIGYKTTSGVRGEHLKFCPYMMKRVLPPTVWVQTPPGVL